MNKFENVGNPEGSPLCLTYDVKHIWPRNDFVRI